MRKKSKFDVNNPNDIIEARKYFHSDHYTWCYSMNDIDKIPTFSLVYVQGTTPLQKLEYKQLVGGELHYRQKLIRRMLLVLGKRQREKIKKIMFFGFVSFVRPRDWIGLIRYSIQDKKEIKKFIKDNIANKY